MISKDKNMSLDKTIQQHIAKMPADLQTEVYEFILFLEYKQKTKHKKNRLGLNGEVIQLTAEEQENFVQSLLNPKEPNAKLKASYQHYLEKVNE